MHDNFPNHFPESQSQSPPRSRQGSVQICARYCRKALSGDFVHLLRTLSRRLGFQSLRKLLETRDIPTGRGLDELVTKLTATMSSDSGVTMATLGGLNRQTLLLGKRAIELFPVPTEQLQDIRGLLSQAVPDASCPYLPAFPLPLSEGELVGLEGRPWLCEVRAEVHATTLVFCRHVTVEERERRPIDSLGSELVQRQGWGAYADIILIRREHIQTFDAVRLHHQPDCEPVLELSVEVHEGIRVVESLSSVEGAFNALIGNPLVNSTGFMLPKNLFPAIRPLYDKIAAGQVCELGFRTLTGSAVSEKRAHQDIRDELFHDHGIRALQGAWTPHTIALRCTSTMVGHSFTYQLPGGIRLLGSPSPQLSYMVIDHALSEDDMLTAIGHVLSQLPHVDQPSP